MNDEPLLQQFPTHGPNAFQVVAKNEFFRFSKAWENHSDQQLPHDSIIIGHDDGDGWVSFRADMTSHPLWVRMSLVGLWLSSVFLLLFVLLTGGMFQYWQAALSWNVRTRLHTVLTLLVAGALTFILSRSALGGCKRRAQNIVACQATRGDTDHHKSTACQSRYGQSTASTGRLLSVHDVEHGHGSFVRGSTAGVRSWQTDVSGD